jgi:autotransporter-associated beta strand protein
VIDYPNGTDNPSPIVLTNNTTQLQVLTGTASQSGIISQSGGSFGLEKIGGGTLILLSSNSYTGTTTITAGALQLGQGTSAISIAGPIVDNAQLIYVASGGATTLGNITGSGSLVVTGTGQGLTLTGTNSYGDTIISCNCVVNVGNGGTTGSLGTGSVTNNGLLIFNRSDTVTISSAISGTGGLIQNSTGTLIFTVPQSYTGSTSTQAGSTLILSGAGSLANSSSVGLDGTLDISATTNGTTIQVLGGSANSSITLGNKTLTISNNANLFSSASFNGNITGSGSVIIAAGFQSFGGANSYTGTTTIASGATLRTTSSSQSLATSSNVIVNGTLDLNGIGATVKSISGSGVVDGGSLTITNASGVFPGTIGKNLPASLTIAGGTQTLGGANALSNVTVNTGATLAISGAGSFAPTNGTFTDNGTFDISAATSPISVQFLSGAGAVILGSNTLILANFGGTGFTSTFSGVISGTGGVTVTGGTGGSGANRIFAGNNTYTGVTTIQSGGTLQIGTGGTTGAIVSNVADSGTLIFNRSDTSVYAGAISGSGIVKQLGTGTLILTGANTYSGDTTISAGTLQIGNGGTTGSITSNIVVGGTFGIGAASPVLVFNRSDNVTFSNSILNVLPSTLIKQGAGMLTLAGSSTFSGATTVSAGTLNVTGALASSAITVQSGATLSGTGKVGSTTIASGGTVNPGSSATPGTLSVTGNLSMAPGSNYLDVLTPTAVGLTTVSGTANLNGVVSASIASGTVPFGRFTLLTATGGVSGVFTSLAGIPAGFKAQLSYDANNAYLTLSPNSLAPSLTNLTGNQQNVVSAIDAAVAAGQVPPAGFAALYGLSGPALNSALDQISGQAAPNVTNAVGNSFLSFMSMTAQGGSGATGNFAPGSAYGGADAPHRAQLGTGETRVWGAVYGGHVGLSADSLSGAASLSSNNVGMIGGADMKVADGLLAGVTMGLGRQTFRSGNGSGDSDDLMFGLYGRADAGAAYVAASFGFGWHQIKTLRVITVSGTDVLQGKQNADDFGGRIEAGWHLPLDDTYTVTPYGAFAGSSFESPAYTETALSGASTFALSYGAQTTTLGRSELGAHLDRSYALEQGTLMAGLRAAWAHQLDDLPFTQASFIGLPGAAFQVAGVRPAPDNALLGLDLEVQNASGLFFGLHGEGQFGAGTTAVEGLGNFGWRW